MPNLVDVNETETDQETPNKPTNKQTSKDEKKKWKATAFELPIPRHRIARIE